MIIKCIHDINECKKLWEKFSAKKSIYDEWEFRFCFYKYVTYELYFYVGIIENEIIGLLPLQYNMEEKHLEFFGGPYMEDNRIFIDEKNYKYIPNFYESLKLPAKLIISQEDPYTKTLPLEDWNYFFPLNGTTSSSELFKNLFSIKTQKTFQRKFHKLEKSNIVIVKDKSEDMDLLIDLNIKRFGEDSMFLLPDRKKIFHDILDSPFECILFTFVLNNLKQAVSLSIHYKDIYYYLASGTNTEIDNLGNYVVMKNIDEAIRLHAKVLDAGPGDCGWKERWHAKKTPQYYLHISQNKS